MVHTFPFSCPEEKYISFFDYRNILLGAGKEEMYEKEAYVL